MSERTEVPDAVVDRLRSTCLALPEVVEEEAWVGRRWTVRKKNFAHVVAIDDGWPPAYAQAVDADGPLIVLTVRSSGPELEVLSHAGHPYFKPEWFPDIVGLVLDDDTDWDEVAELVTDSYCLLAPKRLAAQVDRPG